MNDFSYKNCNLSDSQDIPIPEKRSLPFGNHGEARQEHSLTTPNNHRQGRNPSPGIYKILPPAMQNRDLQTNLMPALGHLRRHQPHTPPDPLNMLLPIKRRQHQIPQPIRQIVCQLRTQHVHPVGHKIPHRQMAQKLVSELPNPSLRRPLPIMEFQKALDLSFSVRHNDIIRIRQRGKQNTLASLGLFLLPPHQESIGLRPRARLIPKLPIRQRSVPGVFLPVLCRQTFNLSSQRSRLICGNAKLPSPFVVSHIIFIKRGLVFSYWVEPKGLRCRLKCG